VPYTLDVVYVNSTELLSAIQLAFDKVPRPDISMRQFQLADQYGMSREITDTEWADAASCRSNSRWQDVLDSEIEACGCAAG
jgi:hypothetical protein